MKIPSKKDMKRIARENYVFEKQVFFGFELMKCYEEQLEEIQGDPTENQWKEMSKILMEVYEH